MSGRAARRSPLRLGSLCLQSLRSVDQLPPSVDGLETHSANGSLALRSGWLARLANRNARLTSSYELAALTPSKVFSVRTRSSSVTAQSVRSLASRRERRRFDRSAAVESQPRVHAARGR